MPSWAGGKMFDGVLLSRVCAQTCQVSNSWQQVELYVHVFKHPSCAPSTPGSRCNGRDCFGSRCLHAAIYAVKYATFNLPQIIISHLQLP
jgi:hypothetical protein